MSLDREMGVEGVAETVAEEVDHQVEGGLAVPDRLAEVAPQGARQEAPVLDDEGIVEAHGLAEAADVLRAASGGSSTSAGSPVRYRMKKTTKDTPSSTSSDCKSLPAR